MNPLDWIVLAAVAVLAFGAWRLARRKGCSCGGDCSRCAGCALAGLEGKCPNCGAEKR